MESIFVIIVFLSFRLFTLLMSAVNTIYRLTLKDEYR